MHDLTLIAETVGVLTDPNSPEGIGTTLYNLTHYLSGGLFGTIVTGLILWGAL